MYFQGPAGTVGEAGVQGSRGRTVGAFFLSKRSATPRYSPRNLRRQLRAAGYKRHKTEERKGFGGWEENRIVPFVSFLTCHHSSLPCVCPKGLPAVEATSFRYELYRCCKYSMSFIKYKNFTNWTFSWHVWGKLRYLLIPLSLDGKSCRA